MSKRTIEFDMLKMYFCEPYEINLDSADGSITVLQPTIGDIVRIGESKFYATLNVFTANTTMYRVSLWDMGIDWNSISDFDLFCLLYQGIDNEVATLLFKDLDFSKFQLMSKRIDDESSEVVLYDTEHQIEINRDVYDHISQYLREMFKTFPEDELTKDPILKKWWVEKDKREIARKELKPDSKNQNTILSLISSCVNHPGFKYSVKELREVGVCQFYDSVQRLQIYENATACLKGIYSGMVDSSKIKPEQYNFMRPIDKTV